MSEIRKAFRRQREWCTKLGSPFTARLMDVLQTGLDETTLTGSTILNWPSLEQALSDAVALRLAGALNALVRCGGASGLAALYPPNPLPDPEALAVQVRLAMAQADDELNAYLRHPPQTNETSRSALIYPGLMAIARQFRLPLQLFELGASAGLNLVSDRFSYQLGNLSGGEPASLLKLAPGWEGPDPAFANVEIVKRLGCDRAPLSVHRPEDMERLISYIWPDQPERLQRVQQAITIAQAESIELEQAEAADWIEQRVALKPVTGVARVVYHSIAWQYFDPSSKQRISDHLDKAGALATVEAPLAWLTFEMERNEIPCLTLKLWPTGEEQILAYADAHVRQVKWSGDG